MKKHSFVCLHLYFILFLYSRERQEMFCSEGKNQKWSEIAGKLGNEKTLRKKWGPN